MPESKNQQQSLELLKGKLFLNISADEMKKRGAGEFRLRTPAALLAVKGTKFFATSGRGDDVIGVLEGGVAMLANSSKAVINISAGQAVTIKAGVTGAVRSLSAEERRYQSEFDAGELARSTFGIVLGRGLSPGQVPPKGGGRENNVPVWVSGKLALGTKDGGAGLRIAGVPLTGWFLELADNKEGEVPGFEDSNSSNPVGSSSPDIGLGEIGIKLGNDGVVSYTWNWAQNSRKKIKLDSGSLLNFKLRAYGNPPDIAFNQIVAMGFKIRTHGIDVVKARFLYGGTAIFKPDKAAGDSEWQECFIPMAEEKRLTNGVFPASIYDPVFSLIFYPAGVTGSNRPTRKDTASIAISDIALYFRAGKP